MNISSNYCGQSNIIGQVSMAVASTKDEWLGLSCNGLQRQHPVNYPRKMGQNNKEKGELTVLSNCALVAPHFNAIAIPYWSPIYYELIDKYI